ncbi:MAG: N-acetylmuramic acid 6-phosphate etherase [Propionibacteriaceae bacterium]|jgi:N-acetylmuramic acid 6-phosphate etherase|nr:N-acetylmuramic acid 6-phosphate etherase [Propionibacteriaceae bacterium]
MEAPEAAGVAADDAEALAGLTTEAADPRWHNLDALSVAELAEVMNEADASVPEAVRAALPMIVPAIEATAGQMAAGGRLIYVGAGTPGRLAILDASECPPTFSTPPGLVTAVMAGGLAAVVNAVEGAEDDGAAAERAMDDLAVGPADTVVGITSSGRTPFVVAAVRQAGRRGALTVGLSCNRGAVLSAAADHPIEVEVGPEVITGSTRLKAGTAQKLVLNMFSTIAMVRLGKTYGSLMIDVKASNHKLRERAIRIVRLIAEVDRAAAVAALEAAGFRVKPAVVMLVRGVGLAAAEARLERAQGRLRRALEEEG